MSGAPPWIRVRLAVSILVGIAVGALTRNVNAVDFAYPWVAARALIHGLDPYVTVAHTQMPFVPALFYPMTTVVLALPFAALPFPDAATLFRVVAFSCLAFGLTRGGYWRLVLLMTAPAYQAARAGQWSPIMTAAAIYPAWLGLLAAKPNLALPLVLYQGRLRLRTIVMVAAGGSALIVMAFALQPNWISGWLATFRKFPASQSYLLPITQPMGAVLALAALRWRRPEGRLLLGMAFTPQTGFFYEQLPLILAAQSRVEILALGLTSHIALGLANRFTWGGDLAATSARCFPYVLLGVYLPALVIVLRRPNAGSAPAWLERLVTPLPQALRGRPAPAGDAA